MFEIKEELSADFNVEIVDSITEDNRFNLIQINGIQKIILQNIKEEIVKSGI